MHPQIKTLTLPTVLCAALTGYSPAATELPPLSLHPHVTRGLHHAQVDLEVWVKPHVDNRLLTLGVDCDQDTSSGSETLEGENGGQVIYHRVFGIGDIEDSCDAWVVLTRVGGQELRIVKPLFGRSTPAE